MAQKTLEADQQHWLAGTTVTLAAYITTINSLQLDFVQKSH